MGSFSKKNKHKTKKNMFEIKPNDEPARSPDFWRQNHNNDSNEMKSEALASSCCKKNLTHV